MAEYDITKTVYTLKIALETKEVLELTDLCKSLSWSEQEGNVAAKADIVIANTKIDKGYISDLIKLCTNVYIFANGNEVFHGKVWDWSYSSALQKEITLTAYDEMIYLTQSKTNTYFSSGMSTQAIIESICSEWGIAVDYKWENHTHGKMPIKDKTISQHITDILDEAQTKLNSKYVALMSNGKLEIKAKGSNTDIFFFHAENVVNVKNSLNLQNLVTRVLIMGKSEENTRPPLLETVDGDIDYGVLQEIVTKDTNNTIEDAKKEANNILKDKGKPNETISVSTVDVPIIRKGDKIKLVAGNLSGYFFVEGVTHNAADKTMDMELTRE